MSDPVVVANWPTFGGGENGGLAAATCAASCWPNDTRNSSGDEITNVNFLRRHRTRTTAHNKVRFAYGKHTCPQLPNETLTIDSRIGLDSATGSSQDVTSYRHSVTVDKMEKYGIP